MKRLICGVSLLLAMAYGTAFANNLVQKTAYASDTYSLQLIDDTSSDADDSDNSTMSDDSGSASDDSAE